MFSITLTPIDFGSAGISSIVDSDSTINSVDENSPSGTTVGITASASDGAHAITYTLVDDDGGRFAINGSTGVVTLVGALDRETDGASRNITVRATSAGGTFSERTFSIAVGDVDEFDVGSVTDTNASSNSVAELVPVGTVVGVTAAASDADATATITYSLTDDAGGKFAIDASTGVVATAADIDREADGSALSITIRATSSDGSFAEQSFTINISDVNEFAISAISDTDASANEVLEHSTSGTAVGITAHATDADATDTVTYSLTNDDGGKFAIDGSTGVVTLVGSLDYATDGPTRTIVVRATSSDGTYSDQSFTINVLDWTVASVSPLQWNLDGGNAYESSTLDSFQVLRSLESYGTYRKPRSGRCGLFDGTDDYATNSSFPATTSAVTIAAWVKPSASTQQAIAHINNLKVLLRVESATSIGWYPDTATTSVTITVPNIVGAWNHVAITQSGTSWAFYLNGSLVNSGTTAALVSAGTGVFVGRYSSAFHFNGSMRDVRIYSTAKSAAEVLAIKNQASTPTTIDRTGLLAGWWLNEEAGTTAYDWSGNGKHLTLTNITTSTFHAADTGVTYNPANFLGHSLSGSTVIPRNEADITKDAAGNALGNTGQCPHPALIETPCITGDSTTVYVDLSSVTSTLGNIDETEFWFYTASDITAASSAALIGGTGAFRTLAYLGSFSGALTSETLSVISSTGDVSAATYIRDTIPAGWNKVKYVWSDALSRYRIYLNDVERTVYSSTGHATKISNMSVQLLAYSNHSAISPCRIASFSITTAGVTTHFVLQGGPGSSNTNRDVHWVKTDGTYGTITGAILNGTVSTIWANRCPGYVQDWCANYGGRLNASGAFVPGQIAGSLCADGNTKTLSINGNKHGNPSSRFSPNLWAAPEMRAIGATTSTLYAPGAAQQSVSPADTKFRRTASDGDDRFVSVATALTGTDKTNMEAYVA